MKECSGLPALDSSKYPEPSASADRRVEVQAEESLLWLGDRVEAMAASRLESVMSEVAIAGGQAEPNRLADTLKRSQRNQR
jgi:hypothetical protein